MNRTSPLKAIRKFCLECAGSSQEVAACTADKRDIALLNGKEEAEGCVECPLWPFRLGHRPGYTRKRAGEGKKIEP